MTTIAQLIKKPRRLKTRKTNTPAFFSAPQKKGFCIKVLTQTPKKPNSALRKIARVELTNKQKVSAHIPGEGHNLQEFSTVLIRGAKIRDLPGVRYRVIRGAFDCSGVTRNKSRSKYGVKKKR